MEKIRYPDENHYGAFIEREGLAQIIALRTGIKCITESKAGQDIVSADQGMMTKCYH